MRSRYGDGDQWCLMFISQGFDFTEEDLTAVRCEVELPGRRGREREQQLLPLNRHDRPGGGPNGSYRGQWNRDDGLRRMNRLTVSCTGGYRPGPTAQAYHVLKQRYPSARFTMDEPDLRQKLNEQGLDIVAP
jgi:hypothetical protein